VYAATDERARTPREKELCASASQFDYVYWGSTVLLTAGAILLDGFVIQPASEPVVRLSGPALVGLTWGGVLGGGYLSLPKCEPGLVRSGPPEGDVHRSWPGALAIALVAGATAPLIVGIETGTGPTTAGWSTEERAGRLVTAGIAGFIGALVPYLLPPKTWRAAKELERIRAGGPPQLGWGTAPDARVPWGPPPNARGGFLTYALRF
jgi:hypothetical protein